VSSKQIKVQNLLIGLSLNIFKSQNGCCQKLQAHKTLIESVPDGVVAFRGIFRRHCPIEELFPREIEKTIRKFC